MEGVRYLTALAVLAAAYPLAVRGSSPRGIESRTVDTVYVRTAVDYDELARHVAARLAQNPRTTTIEGDLIVKGRLGVGGAPEPGTDYGITVRGGDNAQIRFIANEALRDPQREGTQRRHVGTVGVSQDGGLRMDQNSTCFTDSRGCLVDDRLRRRAYSGYDSLGDMSYYLSEVDPATGAETAPRAQSLVFRLLDWDGNIRIAAHRPGQRIFINASRAINASDLQWEVPFP